jgi:membrane protein DedA with SNARE-associated domain
VVLRRVRAANIEPLSPAYGFFRAAMKQFFAGAMPFYALAALATITYLLLYRTNFVDLNAIVYSAVGSPYFPLFIFTCIVIEALFPYFGYFPGTAIVLLSVGLNTKSVDLQLFAWAWLGIVLGAILSYAQAKFMRPWLYKVASRSALMKCEALFDSYGRYARVAMFIHPNTCAMYFTALGLLGRKLPVELAYLCVGAALSAVVLFAITARIISSLGASDGGELQVLLAFALVAIGTAVGCYSAWRSARFPK